MERTADKKGIADKEVGSADKMNFPLIKWSEPLIKKGIADKEVGSADKTDFSLIKKLEALIR